MQLVFRRGQIHSFVHTVGHPLRFELEHPTFQMFEADRLELRRGPDQPGPVEYSTDGLDYLTPLRPPLDTVPWKVSGSPWI